MRDTSSERSARSPEPAPDTSATDYAAAVEHMLMAIERMAGILEHAATAVPTLGGLTTALAGLRMNVVAARAALTPPVDIPPKE